MDLTLLHPKLVHLPIALAVLIPMMVVGLWVARSGDWLPKRVWWIAMALQLLLVGSSFVAMQTGEIDEERAEQVVPEAAIEAHEEAAEVFSWATIGLLPLFLGLGLIEKRGIQHGLAAAALVGSSAILFLGYRVGEAGGAIVYELGLTRLGPGTGSGAPTPTITRYDDDDD